MGIMKKKEAYVTKGTRLIEEKKLPEATEVVVDGLNYYQNKIIKALNGHPVADTALVEWLDKKTTKPELRAQRRVEKTRKR